MLNTTLLFVFVGIIILLSQISSKPLTDERIGINPAAIKYIKRLDDISTKLIESLSSFNPPSHLKQFPILEIFGFDENSLANNSIKLPTAGENSTVGNFVNDISTQLSNIESDLQVAISNFELSLEQNVLAFELLVTEIIKSNSSIEGYNCTINIRDTVQQFTNIGIDNTLTCISRELNRLRQSLTTIQNMNYEWNYAVQKGIVRVGLLLSVLKAIITVPRNTAGIIFRFPTCQSVQALNTVHYSLSMIASIGTCSVSQSV